ncbi:MAG: histidinol-phosphatase [Planctomycetota bacterium]
MSLTPSTTAPSDSPADPRLVYETHLHTTLCKHAHGDLWEYCERAIARGLAGITVTCHCPMPDGHSAHIRMCPDDFDVYLERVAEARDAYGGRLDVRLGLECDYFPGYEDHVEQLLWRAEFDFVLGSVHPQLPEYREAYWMGDPVAFMHCYFEHLAQAAESGLFDSLAHPDLVKNMVSRSWKPGGVVPLVSNYLDRIARTGVCMELNTSGRYKPVPEFNPGSAMLRAMRQRDIGVTVGADAHQPWRVADLFEEAYDTLRDAGYTDACLFAGRERYTIGLDEAHASLKSDHLDELDGSSMHLEPVAG